jgi:TPR repeat protein
MLALRETPYAPEPARHDLPLPRPDSSGDELFKMGLLYSTGQGGAPLDYVSAHMLFNLAAMRGSLEAKIYRKEISQEMASGDVAEAQRAAREWLSHG